jgi:hypothetical protein
MVIARPYAPFSSLHDRTKPAATRSNVIAVSLQNALSALLRIADGTIIGAPALSNC